MKTLLSILTTLALAPSACATFHLMQVEQVIGALDGDTSAQAIQLRMRSLGENLVSGARVRAWSAAGTNPVLVLDITANVANNAAGSRVLLATAAFTTAVQAITPGFAPDFTIASPIPASYLAAGRLTYESDAGTILWSLAWGGAGYTGSNTGAITNDADGNFGPPFGQSLPTAGRQGVVFTGTASAPSTNNANDYTLGPIPATVVRNNGTSYVIGTVLTALEAWRNTWFGSTSNTGNAADTFDFDNDGLINLLEFAFGLNPKRGDSLALPQPKVTAGVFGVTFTQPAGVSGITYGAEWSSTLAAGSWTPIPDTGSGSTHTFNVPVGGNPRMFMRYVVKTP